MMTEEEWCEASVPFPMLEFMRDKANDRLFRLVACACCRRAWSLLTHIQSRRLVEVAESYVDGKVSEDERRNACDAANEVGIGCYAAESAAALLRGKATYSAQKAASRAAFAVALHASGDPLRALDYAWMEDDPNLDAEYAMQARIVRDIFGNPFTALYDTADAWRRWNGNDGSMLRLCTEMYEQRNFDKMDVLAHMLREAGCDEPELLSHCQNQQDHYRGCWVVDLILGKR